MQKVCLLEASSYFNAWSSHCSEGERWQFQGSFGPILPPDNLSGNCSSNICLPPGRDINGFKHKLICCQICHPGCFIQEVWQAESSRLLCCQAWMPWDPAIRQPEPKDFESELPLYLFNHLLWDYIRDFFFLHWAGIYLAFNMYLLIGFHS